MHAKTIPNPAPAIVRRRFRQVCLALARCEADFEQVEARPAELAARAARLRAERDSLREVLDREGGRR